MAQPLYFLQGIRQSQFESIGNARAILKERGLTDVFADVAHVDMPFAELKGRGPNDLAGGILYYKSPATDIPRRSGYTPAEQIWTDTGNGVWVGVDPSEPPTEEDLRRKRQYGGYRIEFDSGGRWLIPTIRRPDDKTQLPTDMHWDATGQLVEPVKPAYEGYWAETREVLEWHTNEWQDVPRARALELAVRAMSLNYRLDKREQNVLRVIDTTNIFLILHATIGGPDADALLEKKTKSDQLTPNSGHGSADTTPSTDQPASSCT